jgi:hypothetical protein
MIVKALTKLMSWFMAGSHAKAIKLELFFFLKAINKNIRGV